jgi:UDP-N-acetylmuramate: L-alanyl-gamma-D-glutamyl-meso-diaminopimelate ligase
MSTTLQLLGHYNVRNALAAIAVASDTGLVPGTLNEGLRAFRGVRRRLEVRGTIKGITVYDDFAHHPTAVAETLTAVRGATSTGTIWAIFEPRSATSCRRVFQEKFVTALRRADEVLLAPVYRSSLPDSVRLNPEEVVNALDNHGVHARYIPRLDDLVELLGQEAKNGDHLVIMSNGAFGGIHEKVLARLAERV